MSILHNEYGSGPFGMTALSDELNGQHNTNMDSKLDVEGMFCNVGEQNVHLLTPKIHDNM